MTAICRSSGSPGAPPTTSAGAPGRALSPRGRRGGVAADPRGDEQPGDLRLPPGGGDGEPDLSSPIQPQADSPGDAAARVDAGTPGASSPRAAARWSDPAARLQSALVLGR